MLRPPLGAFRLRNVGGAERPEGRTKHIVGALIAPRALIFGIAHGLDVRERTPQKPRKAPPFLLRLCKGGKIDADDELRTERPAHIGGDGIREGAVIELAPVHLHALEEGRDGRGRRDRTGEPALSQNDQAVVLPVRRTGGKGKGEGGKIAFEIVFKELFGKGEVGKGAQVSGKLPAVDGLHDAAHILRGISLCKQRPDDRADGRARHKGEGDARLLERLQRPEMRHALGSPASEGDAQADGRRSGAKELFQPGKKPHISP